MPPATGSPRHFEMVLGTLALRGSARALGFYLGPCAQAGEVSSSVSKGGMRGLIDEYAVQLYQSLRGQRSRQLQSSKPSAHCLPGNASFPGGVPSLVPRKPQLQVTRPSLLPLDSGHFPRLPPTGLQHCTFTPSWGTFAVGMPGAAAVGSVLPPPGASSAGVRLASGAPSAASATGVLGSGACGASLPPEVPPVVLVLDIETTGMVDPRIVEFAIRDMAGGKGSTMETLVNPGPDAIMEQEAFRLHGIRMNDLQKPHVPGMDSLGPDIFEFVESRRLAAAADRATWSSASPHKANGSSAPAGLRLRTTGLGTLKGKAGSTAGSGTHVSKAGAWSVTDGGVPALPGVMLVAHCGSAYDFVVLEAELLRCNLSLPKDWLLLDSFHFMRRIFKGVPEHEKPPNFQLETLYGHFSERHPTVLRRLNGDRPPKAHRAMDDVHMLVTVLQGLLLKVPHAIDELLTNCKTVEASQAQRRKNKENKVKAAIKAGRVL